MKISRSVFTTLGILGLLGSIQTTQAFASAAARDAVDAYNHKKYEDACSRFQEALVESPDDPAARFNLASAEYQTGKFSEAARGFEDVLSQSNNAALKQKALYNLGNTAFRQGNLQASTEYYRKALDLNPADAEAKQNLEFVLKELEKQRQQKNEQGQKENEKSGEQQQSKERNNQKDSKKINKQRRKSSKHPNPTKKNREHRRRLHTIKTGKMSPASLQRPGLRETGKQRQRPLLNRIQMRFHRRRRSGCLTP